jgi:YidC/Oxa1 family membrane protein insertase
MMKDENQRNLILAMVLSLTVLLGWQYFIVNPRVEADRARQQAQGQQASPPSGPAVQPQTGQPAATPSQAGGPAALPGTAAAVPVTREQALAGSPRVQIDTPRLSGTVALRGGRIDDLTLKGYRETVERGSPNVVLFNPSGSQNAFYTEVGVVGPQGTAIALPTPQTVWTQEGAGALTPANPVVLTWDNGQGLTFRRTYTVDANYMFTVTEEVRNNSGQPVTLNPYALVQRDGAPRTLGFFILHEGLLGVLGQSGLREVNYGDLDRSQRVQERATTGWLGITDKYWAATVIPDQRTPYQGSFVSTQAGPLRSYQSVYVLDGQTIAPGAAQSFVHRIFAGAKEVAVVDAYQERQNIDRFDRLIDWGWFYFITKPLFSALYFFSGIFGNFGVSILVVTLIIKLIFFPLANKSYESMARMKKVQPEMMALKERYPDDKMKQQQEMMELYKREKINPVSGCLPILLQIPVFFALYKVLFVSIEMRHAPFFGWIRDLSAPDPTSIFNLFGLLPYSVPEFLLVGVWPIIMGITMWLQMKMNPEPPDQIQRMIFGWMPVVFTFMLASFPAGLVIYWAWNNALSIAQQWVIMRRNGVKVELFDNLRGMFRRKPATTS